MAEKSVTWRLWWLPPAFVFLLFSSLQMHLEAVSPTLDSSWLGALSYFASRRLQYGTDVIFTYGPLAYLGTGVYSGYLYWHRIIGEFAFKAVSAGLLCWVIAQLRPVWAVVFLGFYVLFVLPAVPEVSYFLGGTILLFFLLRGRYGIYPSDLLVIASLTVLSLMKYNYLLLVLLGIAAATMMALLNRDPRRAAGIIATFVGFFLLAWACAHQQFANLGAYLAFGIEISRGYKEAMGATVSSGVIVALGLLCLGVALAQLALIVICRQERKYTLIALFAAAAIFLAWQHGFIRADAHVITFFAFCPAALVSVWATGVIKPLCKWPFYSTAGIVGWLCILGIYMQDKAIVTRCLENAAEQIQAGWNIAFHARRIEGELKQQLQAQRTENELPRVKQEVGEASIDVLGYEQAVALLNELNYTPRPVFQGYSAYTEWLIDANRQFYRSSRAPAYALVKYQTIDNRLPALDDSAVLKELIYKYAPLFTEKGYSLWKKVPESANTPAGAVLEGVTTFGKEVVVPENGIVWIELQLRKSFLGKMLSLPYRSPIMQISVIPSNGPTSRYRLIGPMAASGFFISPLVLTGDELLRLSQAESSRATKSFILEVDPSDEKFFESKIAYRMTFLPPVPR
jgi:hypothetical protein